MFRLRFDSASARSLNDERVCFDGYFVNLQWMLYPFLRDFAWTASTRRIGCVFVIALVRARSGLCCRMHG